MPLARRALLASSVVLATGTRLSAATKPKPRAPATLRIGVLTDSARHARATAGAALACAGQAASEASAALPSLRVELLHASHGGDPDNAAIIATDWLDHHGVDAIVDAPNSGITSTVAAIARMRDRVFLATGSAIPNGDDEACGRTTIRWGLDPYLLARSTCATLLAKGARQWFFLAADEPLGYALTGDAIPLILQNGGAVSDVVRYPPAPRTADYTPYFVQAQVSGAHATGFASTGADLVAILAQARSFGLAGGGMTLASLLTPIEDIHALGLDKAQGLHLSDTFYWDLNQRTRAFTSRVRPLVKADWRPNQPDAAAYAAVLHYLKAAASLGPSAAQRSGAATVARMQAMPTDDDAFGKGHIRADGMALHPAYLFTVKSPAESTGPWDCCRLAEITAAKEAARPVSDAGCMLSSG